MADNEEDEHSEFLVPTAGDPSPAWINMTSVEKQDSKVLTLPQRFGEDAQDRSIKDAKWIVAFSDATAKGSLVCSSKIALDLCLFGSDLALTAPDITLSAHEWINDECLRPQTHSHV